MSKVFLFACTAALNPTLLAATTVMLLLPRPRRLMLGYLLGAYVTGISIGLVIVHWLNGSGTVSTTKHAVDPALDITLGLLTLLVAFVVGTGRQAKRNARRKREQADHPKKTPRWQQALSKGTARTTFVVGLLLSFPGASYLAALTEIHKQQLGTAATVLTGDRGQRRHADVVRAAADRLHARAGGDSRSDRAVQGVARPKRAARRRDWCHRHRCCTGLINL